MTDQVPDCKSSSSETHIGNDPSVFQSRSKRQYVYSVLAILFILFVAGIGSVYWMSQKKFFENPIVLDEKENIPKVPLSTESFDVILKPQGSTSLQTDVYIKNKKTGEERFFKTISEVYQRHYHAAEYRNGKLYIIRRTGGADGYMSNPSWTDELWEYSEDAEGIKLYSMRGLDFRVSPQADLIVIEDDGDFLFFRTKTIVYQFSKSQLHDENNTENDALVKLLSWSDNGINLWGLVTFTMQPIIFKINTNTWQVKKYDVSELNLSYRDFDLQPNTGKIVYSDYPFLIDSISADQFRTEQKPVTLYVYDLATSERRAIAASTQQFNPLWIDESTIEFDNPENNERTTIDL